MNRKVVWGAFFALGFALIAVGVLVVLSQQTPTVRSRRLGESAGPAAFPSPTLTPRTAMRVTGSPEASEITVISPPELVATPRAGSAADAGAPATQSAAAEAGQAVAEPEPMVPEAVAREALAYVGADPVAEAIWMVAINDPDLSDNARSNLIEDLNEDGFADPDNVTLDELPLVVNRLFLIEEIAGDAMDQTNADAFAEAYKDLINIYNRLTGTGN